MSVNKKNSKGMPATLSIMRTYRLEVIYYLKSELTNLSANKRVANECLPFFQ